MKSLITCLFILVFASISTAQIQTGKASFYADKFEGSPTANGEKYKHNKLTAAHKFLPFGTIIKVTNLSNNASVEVRVNDRGPYVEDRIVDLSRSAAEKLGFVNQGITEVKIEVIDAGDGKGKSQIVPIDHVVVEEKEFYGFTVERITPSGFGVQIGTYQELVNLMRLSDNLKNSYKKKVSVQVKVLSGVKYYSLIIGKFSSREKADNFLTEIKIKFPGAFVVDFQNL